MATLYSIDQRLLNLEVYGVDTETGEVATTEEDFRRMYDEIQMEMKDKLVNTSCYIKNLLSDAEQIKAEEDRLKARRQQKERYAARLQDAMDNVIKHRINNIDEDFDGCNKWKIDDPKVKISYRRSEKVELVNPDILPKAYINKKVELKPDLVAIKEAIKNGKKVKGAELVSNLNLQIK